MRGRASARPRCSAPVAGRRRSTLARRRQRRVSRCTRPTRRRRRRAAAARRRRDVRAPRRTHARRRRLRRRADDQHSTEPAGAARPSCAARIDRGRAGAALPAQGATWHRRASSASRRWCAGSTRSAACSRRTSSSRVAERTGLIHPLTDLVLRPRAGAGRATGATQGRALPVAVNVSTRSLLDAELRRPVLAALLAATACPRRCSRLEITETHDHGGPGAGPRRCSTRLRRRRRPAVDRRLRHRLLLAGLPEEPAGPRAEDRPVVRRGHDHQRAATG